MFTKLMAAMERTPDGFRDTILAPALAAAVKGCGMPALPQDVARHRGQASHKPRGRKPRNALMWSVRTTNGYGDLGPSTVA